MTDAKSCFDAMTEIKFPFEKVLFVDFLNLVCSHGQTTLIN